ncbi:hypothetical protein ACIGZI_34660 [Streptomyces griseus]|uniref:hypothetical protein n=1 Tax=Streptomyces griseus TaxID=1911 RepID=UPI0037D79A33
MRDQAQHLGVGGGPGELAGPATAVALARERHAVDQRLVVGGPGCAGNGRGWQW